MFESQLAGSILEGDGQLAFKKLATATLETLMPRIEGKGEFGHARWRLVYAPQIPSLLSVDPTIDPLKSIASNISFGTEVEVQLGKRLQVCLFVTTLNITSIISYSTRGGLQFPSISLANGMIRGTLYLQQENHKLASKGNWPNHVVGVESC